jgi:hypothetical protein
MPPDRHNQVITELEIELQHPQAPDSTDYYHESDCHSILLDLRDENFQARSQVFLTHLHSCWTEVDSPRSTIQMSYR